ncbi:MAG: hypothetical protein COZ37_01755 [bacterium (Candidatus Ratteibacteria) CG_4_10_14_3_um_filter_41_18]|uniref:Uncharacterized protein n=1 Tax=bacterium (Candidatus Ratteibacteria) CG_4_10_14_3_um_filter_41_18 TaxID=2014287 RepID=A0A2M7M4J6_9BACT|nr:MAG: hypothetical protein COZ37_01755 [bacterium (Candidatus Ratteibacteria) CG_4_10_14_3_um_filter_41_18]
MLSKIIPAIPLIIPKIPFILNLSLKMKAAKRLTVARFPPMAIGKTIGPAILFKAESKNREPKKLLIPAPAPIRTPFLTGIILFFKQRRKE